jgi:hypothetical protein
VFRQTWMTKFSLEYFVSSTKYVLSTSYCYVKIQHSFLKLNNFSENLCTESANFYLANSFNMCLTYDRNNSNYPLDFPDMNQSRFPHQIKLILNPCTSCLLQISLHFKRNSIDRQVYNSMMVGTDSLRQWRSVMLKKSLPPFN